MKRESYGPDLLQTIGFVYSSKARHYLATNQTFFGVGGWLHNVQGKYHVFSETYVLLLFLSPSLPLSLSPLLPAIAIGMVLHVIFQSYQLWTSTLTLIIPTSYPPHHIQHSVSTLRSAIELKSVFDQIQAAEKAGNLSPEERKKLEEQAAEKGLQALFKVRPRRLSLFPPPAKKQKTHFTKKI